MKIISLLFLFLLPAFICGQTKPVMGSDYFSYVRDMEAYYANRAKGSGTGYKPFKRWEYFMAPKVGRSGIIENFSGKDQAAFVNSKKMLQKAASSRATHGLWEDLGPHDYYVSDSYSNTALGRINCIAFHPTDPDILFAGGPVGGLWKTTNHGDTWECISNDFASIGISDIAIHPDNPDTIYILTGDGDSGQSNSIGVLKTTDGGFTWRKTGLSFETNEIVFGFCLRMNPAFPDTLYAGFGKNSNNDVISTLTVTYDGGESWHSRLLDTAVFDIEFKPDELSTIYAATNFGVYKSTNNGLSFTRHQSDIPMGTVRTAMATSPDAPNNVYLLCGNVSAPGIFFGMCLSTDAGETYTVMSTTPNILGRGLSGEDDENQADWDLCLSVDPQNSDLVFVGAINGWKSNDAGVTWSRETRDNREFGEVDPYVHADWHNVYFKNGRIYSANDGGIVYSDDLGNSWEEISSGLGVTQFYNIAIHNGEYIGGTQDNGTNEATIGNFQMHNILSGDGFGCTWHNSDQSIKFLSSQDGLVRRQFGSNQGIYNASGQFWYTKLEMVNGTDHLFAIKSAESLIRGHQGVEWTWYDSGSADYIESRIKGYAQGVDNTSVIYVASEERLIKSTNIFLLPTPTWDSLPHPDSNLYYAELAIDSFNSDRVWVVCGAYLEGKKVYYSSDGGNTWENISGSLPNIPMRCITAITTGTDALYVGTEIGVFYWNENIDDWIFFSNGLPNCTVLDIKTNGGYIYVGTYGRGIWRTESYTSCPEMINLTTSDPNSPYSPGQQVYSASDHILSNRSYLGSVGTEIEYHAGNFIDLLEGFWAKEGTLFSATSNGCPE